MKPDVNAVLTVRLGEQLKRQWPLALLVMGLGVIALYAGLEDDQLEPTLAGGLMVLLGLVLVIVPRLGMRRDEQVMTELAPSGITYRIPAADGPSLNIGWDDITAIVRVSFTRGLLSSLSIYWREPAIVITDGCLKRLEEEVGLDRSLLWRHYVREGAPGEGAQLVFNHHDFGLPRFRVHEALESRWRAFSRHPHASLPPRAPPLVDRIGEAIDRVFAKPATRLAGVALAVLVLLPSAYYWHYAATWLQRPPNDAQAAELLRDLLDKGGAPALVDRRSLALVRRAEAERVHTPGCRHVIKPDLAARPGLTPAWKRVSTCYAALELRGNRRATAVFVIDVVHHDAVVASDPATGRTTTRRQASVAAVAPDLATAQGLLCQLGYCVAR